MNVRKLSGGQIAVLTVAAVAMLVVGGFGAWGTYTNAVSEFQRQATAAGVVASGEGLTLILALIMLGRTMLAQASPGIVRAGMWVAPVSASFIGISIAGDVREAAVYAVTPLAMSGAAEGLGLIARSIVVYRTGVDAETMRRNADAARQLAYERAVADSHPGTGRRKRAVRRYWRLARYVGVGDAELGAGLVDVQRTRVRAGADAALASMYGAAAPELGAAPAAPARTVSATDTLREHFADMDPAEAIRFAHDARPDAGAAELATVLDTYGVHVDPVAVALVLGHRPPEYEAHRPDTADAPQVRELEPLDMAGTVAEAASTLGPDASPRDIADHIAQHRRLVVTEPYIRTALSRAAKKSPTDPTPNPMEGGYA
ncbi:hypothetical protein [Streptomyces sp. NPDC047990]|uniref:hypothetical protein n=1 Tax=Streptomyces sp. NPDC047990 TaxID=3365496 RepID=UPI00371EE818